MFDPAKKRHRMALYSRIPVKHQDDTEYCLHISDCMGRMPHKKTTTSRVPSLERPIIWSRNRIILENF